MARVRFFDTPSLLGEDDVRTLSSARLVPFYLMASYAYYRLNDNFMEDSAFDLLCSRLYLEWRRCQHPHKHLVDKESLTATTGYAINFAALPLIIQHSAQSLLEISRRGDIRKAITPTKPKRVQLL